MQPRPHLRVGRHDDVAEVGRAQHSSREEDDHEEPEEVPHSAEAGVVRGRVAVPARGSRVLPHRHGDRFGGEREERHHPGGVAGVGEHVRPRTDQDADRPGAAASERQDDHREDGTEHERVCEAHTRPAAMERGWIRRGIHELLGEEVGDRVAGHDGEKGGLDADVLLDEVVLELVGRPAHDRTLRMLGDACRRR